MKPTVFNIFLFPLIKYSARGPRWNCIHGSWAPLLQEEGAGAEALPSPGPGLTTPVQRARALKDVAANAKGCKYVNVGGAFFLAEHDGGAVASWEGFGCTRKSLLSHARHFLDDGGRWRTEAELR